MHGTLLAIALLLPHPLPANNSEDLAAIAKMKCDKPAEVAAWLSSWREKKRLGLAWEIAQDVLKTGLPTGRHAFEPGQAPPRHFYPKGAACLKEGNAFFAERKGDGFLIGCLMSTKTKKGEELSHVFLGEVSVPYNEQCLSDKNFQEFANSEGCKKGQNQAIRTYFMNIGGTPPPPGYRRPPNFAGCGFGGPLVWRSEPRAQPVSAEALNNLLQGSPYLRSVVSQGMEKGVITNDGARFYVKQGIGERRDSALHKNPAGDWPGDEAPSGVDSAK